METGHGRAELVTHRATVMEWATRSVLSNIGRR
jgi:hypothetical protein